MRQDPATSPAGARRRPFLARFARSEDGATAVEFAVVIAPFLFMIFALFEMMMMIWSAQTLERAVKNASREIYTGEYQTAAGNAAKNSTELLAGFKAKVCAQVTALFDCAGSVSIDVRNASTFGAATPPSPVKNGAYDASAYGYETVGPKQIAIVTAAMQARSMMPFSTGAGALSNGNRLLVSTAVFRTEPFPTN